MGDKIDEIFAMIGNKKNLILVIVLYIVVMLVVVTVIWWPKESDFAKYDSVNITEKQTEMAQKYINTISDIFKNERVNELTQLISSEYTKYTEKTSSDIVNELKEQGFLSSKAEVKGANVYTDGDTYVYSTTVYSGNNKRNINIIETYPYKYKIVFDDFYAYEDWEQEYTNQNIKFTIKSIYRNLKYVEINMDIENSNDVYARFDFNSQVGVQAVLEDGTKYSPSNMLSTEAYTNVEANQIVSKNFVFEIPAQLQDGIEYILFNDVSVKFTQLDIKVNI